MKFSFLENIRGGITATNECSWDAFAGVILQHRETTDKTSVPAWSPAYFSRPRRLTSALIGVSLAVLDVDHGPGGKKTVCTTDDLLRVSAALAADGYEHLLISSYRYLQPGGGARARFIVPMTSEVDGKRWKTFWRLLATRYAPSSSREYRLGTYADDKCRDPVHAYFFSSCMPGAPRIAHRHHGRPLDPEEFLRGRPLDLDVGDDAVEVIPACHQAIPQDLKDLERKWSRRKSAPLLFALRALVEGKRIAEDGAKDDTIAKLCFAVIREAPHLTTESLADLFTPSLGAMRVDPAEYRASLVDKIERGRGYREQAQMREERPSHDRPIVQTSRERIYFRLDGRYLGPFTRKQMVEVIRERYPDEVADNRIVLSDAEGKLLSESQIIDRHGQTVLDVSYEVGRREDVVDGDTLVLGCANRVAEPAYVPEVDAFLQAISIARFKDWSDDELFLRGLQPDPKILNDLKTWLVVAKTMPTETLIALQFIGPKAVGKNLFASAVAQLWHNGDPVPADEGFGKFNERLKDCPFLFADEGLPAMAPGQHFTQEFRKLITKDKIKVERKGEMPTTVTGAIRMYFAANDVESLTSDESFGMTAIHAIGDRWYRIHVHPECAERIEHLDKKKIIEGMLPHVMYLAKTHSFEKQGRFWIVGDQKELVADLQTKGGVRDLVLQWLVGWIFMPKKVDIGAAIRSYVSFDRKILVASNDIAENWNAYLPPSSRVPAVRIVGQALKALSVAAVRSSNGHQNGRMRLFEIDVTAVIRWCEASGRATQEELLAAIDAAKRKLQAAV